MRRLRSRLLVLSIAAAAASAAPAGHAADLPVAPAYRPPVYTQAIYDWTGFYLGGNVGYGLLSETVTTTAASTIQTSGTASGLSPSSLLAGGQIGVNWELAPVVIGIEGTWDWTNINGFQVTPSLLVPATSTGSRDEPRWYATVTGRIGYAFNDVLLYAKGGGAFMRINYEQEVLNPLVASLQDIGDTRVGFTVGGGVEWGITEQLSLKAEYDFLDFGTTNYSFGNLSTAPGVAVGPYPVSIRSMLHVFTGGFNYRFNWAGGGPVVAR